MRLASAFQLYRLNKDGRLALLGMTTAPHPECAITHQQASDLLASYAPDHDPNRTTPSTAPNS